MGRILAAGRLPNPLLIERDNTERDVALNVVRFFYAQAMVLDHKLRPFDTLPPGQRSFWEARIRDLLYAGTHEQKNCRWCDPALFMFVTAKADVAAPHDVTVRVAQGIIKAGRGEAFPGEAGAAFRGIKRARIYLDRRTPFAFRIDTTSSGIKSGLTVSVGSIVNGELALKCDGNVSRITESALRDLAKSPR